MTDASTDTPSASLKLPRLLALVAIYFTIAHLVPPPEGVDPQDWRRVGVFFATIGGLMLQPMPGSQVVLVGLQNET